MLITPLIVAAALWSGHTEARICRQPTSQLRVCVTVRFRQIGVGYAANSM